MAIALTTKGRLAVKEQSSSWGTAETSFAATDYLEIIGPFVPPLPRETLGADVYRPANTADGKVKGVTGGTFSFSCYLHGVDASTPSGNPTIHPDATLLKNLLGGGGSDGYSTTVTGGTAAIPTDSGIPAAHVGYAALYPLSSGYSVGWNAQVTTNTSSDLLVDLSAAPAAGTAFGSYTVWLATTEPTPLTFQWLGTDSTSAIRYYDAVPTKITITAMSKQLLKADVEVQFLAWSNDGTGGAPADYAYTYPKLPAYMGANGARALFAGGSSICPSAFTLEMTQTLEPAHCAASTNGVASLKYVDRQVRLSVTRNPSDYSATPWVDEVDDTFAALQIDTSTTPGRAFSVALPLPQLAETPTPTANGSLLGVTNVFEPLVYSADTADSVAAPGDTPFRIAFM